MRKFKENILKILLYLSALITVGILVFIIGFIFIKGYKLIQALAKSNPEAYAEMQVSAIKKALKIKD